MLQGQRRLGRQLQAGDRQLILAVEVPDKLLADGVIRRDTALFPIEIEHITDIERKQVDNGFLGAVALCC